MKIALQAKAFGIIQSIEKIGPEHQSRSISISQAGDYDRLRYLTMETVPSLAELMPPPAETFLAADGENFCSTSYIELLSYVSQIKEMLAVELDEPQ